MKKAYAFVAGNSIVTPAGIAIAIVLALTLRGVLGHWIVPLYTGVLLCTLAVATFERVQ